MKDAVSPVGFGSEVSVLGLPTNGCLAARNNICGNGIFVRRNARVVFL